MIKLFFFITQNSSVINLDLLWTQVYVINYKKLYSLCIKFCRIKVSNCNLRLGTEPKNSTVFNKSRQKIGINRTYSASLTLPINSFGYGHSGVKVTAVWIFLHFVSAQVHDFIQNWTSFNEWKFWQFSFIEWNSFLNDII